MDEKLFGSPNEKLARAWDNDFVKTITDFIIDWIFHKGVVTLQRNKPIELGRKPEAGAMVTSPCSMEEISYISQKSPLLREQLCLRLQPADEAEERHNGVGLYSIPDLIGQGKLGGALIDGTWFILHQQETPHQVREAERTGNHRYHMQGINPVDVLKS